MNATLGVAGSCSVPGDSMWMTRRTSGTPVDGAGPELAPVDDVRRRPPFVLTLDVPLTCDDVRNPQFPHPLLRRRVQSLRGPILIGPGDDVDDRRDR